MSQDLQRIKRSGPSSESGDDLTAVALSAMLVAAIAFLSLLVTGFDWRLIAIGVACAGLGVKELTDSSKRSGLRLELEEPANVPGFIRSTRRRLARLRSHCLMSKLPELTEKIELASGFIEAILERLLQDACSFTQTKQLLVITLDALETLTAKYQALDPYRGHVPQIQETLLSAQGSLDRLIEGLRKHHLRLLEGDRGDLEVEIRLLQHITQIEE